MSVTSFPDPVHVIHWPTPEERREALAVGMAEHNLVQVLTCPAEQVTFHARYALRWGADPRHVAAALAKVAGRQG